MRGLKLTDKSAPAPVTSAKTARKRPARPSQQVPPAGAPAAESAGEAKPAEPRLHKGRTWTERPVHASPQSRPLGETEGPEPDAPLGDVRLAIGSIGGAHGVDGELRMRLSTDDPNHLRRIKHVYVGDETATRQLISIRFHQGIALIQLGGVKNSEQARELTGMTVRISGRDARPLAKNEYYYYQVIGIIAKDEAGEVIGTVSDILETGANDVFVITPADGGKELLFPSIPDVVVDLDPAARAMTLRPQRFWDAEGDPIKPEE